jgi:RNA ligase (TIGR02306 family)
MSSFAVKVRSVTVSEHPNADLLAIAHIEGYSVVVGKDFPDNSLAAYIPEGAIVPAPIIAAMGLEGRLAGAEKNRVKAIRLRGELSQGLLYRPDPFPAHWVEGLDVTEELGITKYQPPIPVSMAGKMVPCPSDILRSYDIENIKAYPDVLQEGERVILSEKLHGSACIVGTDGVNDFVSSKGISARGLSLVEEPGNVYWRVVKDYDLLEKVHLLRDYLDLTGAILYGEVLGVQDLKYGLKPGELSFRAFDIYTPQRGFLSYGAFLEWCHLCEIPTVPILYVGPYSKEKLLELTSGPSTIASHLREGVVIRAEPRRRDAILGGVVLKSVSENYLTRKGNNLTEME